jgi:hypothetical protein
MALAAKLCLRRGASRNDCSQEGQQSLLLAQRDWPPDWMCVLFAAIHRDDTHR